MGEELSSHTECGGRETLDVKMCLLLDVVGLFNKNKRATVSLLLLLVKNDVNNLQPSKNEGRSDIW